MQDARTLLGLSDPRPEFLNLSQDEIKAALSDPSKKTSVAVEVDRLAADYIDKFQAYVGQHPDDRADIMHVSVRSPIEKAAVAKFDIYARDALLFASFVF